MLHIARIAGVSITIYSVCKSNVRCLLIRKGHFQVELAQRPQDETVDGWKGPFKPQTHPPEMKPPIGPSVNWKIHL